MWGDILIGEAEGKTKKGRPIKEWADDITDWCKSHSLEWKTNPKGTSGRISFNMKSTSTGGDVQRSRGREGYIHNYISHMDHSKTMHKNRVLIHFHKYTHRRHTNI